MPPGVDRDNSKRWGWGCLELGARAEAGFVESCERSLGRWTYVRRRPEGGLGTESRNIIK